MGVWGLPPIIMLDLIYINLVECINYGASPNIAKCYKCNYSI